METVPGVSIIIPTYNREAYILRSIESIQNQTYKKWELIILDDGSDDGTEELVNKISDSRIHYVKNQKNIGVAASRNRGVSLAKYDYVAFQDSDDVWRIDKLEKQISFLCNNREYDMVYCSFLNHYIDGHEIIVPNNQVGLREGNLFNTLLINNIIGAPTILMKKEIFIENEGFDASLKALEDWEFVLRVSKNSQIGFLPEILVDAYQTQGSVSFDGLGYYEARCRMISSNVVYLQEMGLFDELVIELFNGAERRGILEPVREIFMVSLQMYYKKV